MSYWVFETYPKIEGKKPHFDEDFYMDHHWRLVDRHWRPLMGSCRHNIIYIPTLGQGLKSWSIIKFDTDDPSGFYLQAMMLWESEQAWQKALCKDIPEIKDGYRCFCNELPIRFQANVLLSGGDGKTYKEKVYGEN